MGTEGTASPERVAPRGRGSKRKSAAAFPGVVGFILEPLVLLFQPGPL